MDEALEIDIENFKEIAFEIGITVQDFYVMTPAELSTLIDIYNRKQKQRHDEMVTVAYLSAYYNRVKKMPNIKDILGKKQTETEQSPSDLLNKLKELNAQLGGEVY